MPFRCLSVLGAGATAVALALTLAAPSSAAPAKIAPKRYANCAALNRVYPHGVGRTNARDHVSRRGDKPVTNFTRNNAVYNLNTARDRDKDGIACEKH